MAEGDFSGQMAASYVVQIEGIARTKSELAGLSSAIKAFNTAVYSDVSSATVSASLGVSDLFVTKIDKLEGRVQTKAKAAMLHAMQAGHDAQVTALRAAVTTTGLKGGRRNGPGRDKTGTMIKGLKHNVETQQTSDSTLVVGWHGWPIGRAAYFGYQEKGTRSRNAVSKKAQNKARKSGSANQGVPAANSLGASIIVAREKLKDGLRGLGK